MKNIILKSIHNKINKSFIVGALFGGIFGGAVMQFGRRKILRLISLPYSLAWIVTIFAESVITLFITAFVAGFCCSVVSMITQVSPILKFI